MSLFYKYNDRKINQIIVLVLVLISNNAFSQQDQLKYKVKYPSDVKVGAERMEKYLPYLDGKSVGLLANHSSMVKNTHLVDTLISINIKVKKVFSPEHGFRGDADAGEFIKNNIDSKTGLPLISLYGSNKKPKVSDLKGIEVVVFDLQDVGARFYTYISSMHYMMEACAENNIQFLVLDRPNPNGFYVDGPVLEERFRSFVGMHPVPVVHGMTVGEYAQMINEEGWLLNKVKCNLIVIPVEGYFHTDLYQLPIKPSPNLSTMEAIYLYPSLCFFEGTIVSVGRGTDNAFSVIGHPSLKNTTYSYTPQSIPGASKNPPYEGIACKGYDLREQGKLFTSSSPKLQMNWLIQTYKDTPENSLFFNSFFNSLAGNSILKQQIINGVDERVIRAGWVDGIEKFKQIRRKYLLYEDFE
ncbi:MAG: DUF1343 domain-containing protein [Bacteroidetes bacterium]|nr:DUF1343 domain-containing protein [Bacteroidota bacterium]